MIKPALGIKLLLSKTNTNWFASLLEVTPSQAIP